MNKDEEFLELHVSFILWALNKKLFDNYFDIFKPQDILNLEYDVSTGEITNYLRIYNNSNLILILNKIDINYMLRHLSGKFNYDLININSQNLISITEKLMKMKVFS